MANLGSDIRYALRNLFKRPGFTLIVVVTLALGIGANTAIFSMLDAVIFRPLPVSHPDQLIKLQTLRPNGDINSNFSYPAFHDYRELNQVCSGLAAYYNTPLSLSGGSGPAERVYGTLASGDYFPLLGVKAIQGRILTPADDQTPGAHPVVVISYGLWQRRFGGSPEAIGKTLEINKHQFSVIGVVPASFYGTVRGFTSDLWLPLMMHAVAVPDDPADTFAKRGLIWLSAFGRLKPGISRAQAAASLEILGRQVGEGHERLGLAPADRGDPSLVDDFAKPLFVLMAGVGLVLLIACANVANLLLVRAGARRKEFAVRLAMGASRWRLVRQLVTESSLLGLAGGVAGLFVALWADYFWLLVKPADTYFPLTIKSGLNWRVLGFALLLSIVTSLLFGLAPAWQSSRFNFTPALKEEIATVGESRRFAIRDLLVILQVSVSLVVLIGAGLLVRSLRQLQRVDVGYQPDRTLVMTLDPSLQGYKPDQGIQFYQSLLERVRALPGVSKASLAATVTPNPGGGRIEDAVQVEGRANRTETITVEYNRVGPEYFATMDIPLRRGRDFGSQDRRGVPPAVIINEILARKIFPGEDALGKRFRFGDSGPFAEIVGVAQDGKYRSLREEPLLCLYEPFLSSYRPEMNLLVRSTLDPGTILPRIRNELAAIDPTIPIFNVRTLEDQVRSAATLEHAAAVLTAVFGGLALLLATIGLYGVMSYGVMQRTREIGIRIALGAGSFDVARLVLARGCRLALTGVAIGVGASLALMRLIRSFLFGVGPTDVLTYALVALVLITVALLACYLPARKASMVDPLKALRYE